MLLRVSLAFAMPTFTPAGGLRQLAPSTTAIAAVAILTAEA
jgi:hypothetical protein